MKTLLLGLSALLISGCTVRRIVVTTTREGVMATTYESKRFGVKESFNDITVEGGKWHIKGMKSDMIEGIEAAARGTAEGFAKGAKP